MLNRPRDKNRNTDVDDPRCSSIEIIMIDLTDPSENLQQSSNLWLIVVLVDSLSSELDEYLVPLIPIHFSISMP